jgi:hypothetical protein
MSRPADRARRFIGRLPNKHSTHLGNTPPASKSPIASDARPRHTSRGFLPWRFAYTGPGVRRATFMRPASANLHTNGLICRSIALSSSKSSSQGRIAHRCSLLRLCALRPRSFRRPPLDVDGCYEPRNLAAIADQPQTRTRRTRQPWPSQKRCVTHSQLPKSSYGPRPAP